MSGAAVTARTGRSVRGRRRSSAATGRCEAATGRRLDEASCPAGPASLVSYAMRAASSPGHCGAHSKVSPGHVP
eukprot:1393073-Prymnesium_polylepis.2